MDDYDSIISMGYKIIAIYESNNTSLKDYLTEIPLPFTVIGDPQLKFYRKYGVEKSKENKLFTKKHKRDGNLARIPADFLIDENGILKVVHYGNNIGDHLPISAILNN